jgi:hypothetical protein
LVLLCVCVCVWHSGICMRRPNCDQKRAYMYFVLIWFKMVHNMTSVQQSLYIENDLPIVHNVLLVVSRNKSKEMCACEHTHFWSCLRVFPFHLRSLVRICHSPLPPQDAGDYGLRFCNNSRTT